MLRVVEALEGGVDDRQTSTDDVLVDSRALPTVAVNTGNGQIGELEGVSSVLRFWKNMLDMPSPAVVPYGLPAI
ncbi:hypothetical protein D3C85_1425120 [compost metagenome]